MSVLDQALSYCVGADDVLVLPSLRSPKLLIPAVELRQRWRISGFYPAYRMTARPWRMYLRIRVLLGQAGKTLVNQSDGLANFLHDVVPNATHTCVLLGAPNTNRKIIVQIWEGNRLRGYLKCSTNSEAAKNLKTECKILRAVPVGCGPALLKQGKISEAESVLLTPVKGLPLKADLEAIFRRLPVFASYFSELRQHGEYPVDEHPKIKWLRYGSRRLVNIDGWLKCLRYKYWPSVIQHGDFAPWNVFLKADGSLCAIDWEAGDIEGFQYFDIIYCILQTACLIHRWSVLQAFRYALKVLGYFEIDEHQAQSLIKLAALDAYLRYNLQTGDMTETLQKFRKDIFLLSP